MKAPLMLHGLEIFPGVGTPLSRTTRYGAAFLGGGNGTLLFGWVNYSPIFFKPGTESTIVGGRWFMLSPKTGLSAGSFRGGKVSWNWNIKLAVVVGELGGGGNFEGVLNHLPFPPRIGLRMILNRGDGVCSSG